MMTGHIAYWFLDTKPLTKSSTHPSNIAKDYILKLIVGSDTSTQEEMRKILTQKPKFIVTQEDIWYLKNKPQAKLLLEDTLNQNYELIKQIRGNQIYRRLNL